MNNEDFERQQRLGERLQRALRLGPDSRPASIRVINEEWAEADRLGRLLLENFDEQDARKRNLNNDEGNNE
jgi:hypothetical protein